LSSKDRHVIRLTSVGRKVIVDIAKI